MTKKLLFLKKKIKLTGLILILTLFIPSQSYAQSATNNHPLVEVLQIIKTRYGADFNYADDAIKGFKSAIPPVDLSFEQVLAFLQASTPLIYRQTADKIVVISKVKKQRFGGKIQDASTGNPVAFALIQSKHTSTLSDSLGLFNLDLYLTDSSLIVSHVAYGNTLVNVTPSKNGFLKLKLRSIPTTLKEVVIDDFIVRGIAKKKTGEYYIDFEDFSILPGLIKSDVLQAIQAIPGVISVNETVSNINIRGGTNDQNLLLWDGIKMYQSGHFFGLISMFNADMTQNVSVRRNGTGPAFTDGVSGTITMSTTQDINHDFSGNIGLDFLNASFFADIPLGNKASLQIASRKSHAGLLQTPTYNQYFKRVTQNTELTNNIMNVVNSDISFDFYDFSLRGLVELSDKDWLRFNFIFSNNELLYTESATVSGSMQSRQSSLGQRSIAEGIYYQHKWNNYWKSTFHIYETDYKLKGINANVPENQRFLQENIVSETGVKFETNKTRSNLEWTSGYHFVETKVTNLDDVDIPIFRTLKGEVIRTHGLYSQLGFTSSNGKLSFNSGLRLNYIEKLKTWRLEPRFNFSYGIEEHFFVEIQGEWKHQNSSQVVNFQNDFLGIEKRRWQLANGEDIPMITSRQLSLGLSYDQHGLLISGEAYHKQINGITSQSQGFQTKYEFAKTPGSYEVKGLDFLVRKKLNKVFIWSGYSLIDNTYTFVGLADKTFPSNLDITHSFSAGTNFENGPLRLSLGINWRTGLPISLPVEGEEIINNEVNFGTANAHRLPSYLRLDFSATYEIIFLRARKLAISASIWNVLNTNNTIGRYFRSNNNSLDSFNEESLDITPNVLLQYYF